MVFGRVVRGDGAMLGMPGFRLSLILQPKARGNVSERPERHVQCGVQQREAWPSSLVVGVTYQGGLSIAETALAQGEPNCYLGT